MAPQLFWPVQLIREPAALLLTPAAQALPSAQVTVHWLPPQTTNPAQESPCPQVTLQLFPCEQSTPPAQAAAPHVI